MSILSAAHDTEPFLAEMIDSVVAQTTGDWELIVVDNGMSDEVVRIVDKYADDPRIRLLRQAYGGLAGGVDAAAAVAGGAYFAVVPSDGRIEPTFCARVAEVLADHPEIDVLCVDALPFLDGTDQPPSFRQRCGITDEPGVEHRVGLAEVVRRPALYSTAAVRASSWEEAGGYAGDTPQLESLAMCLRMLAAGCDLRVLPEPLGRYNLAHPPGDQDEYDVSEERTFLQVAALTDDADVLAALRSKLREVRYESALRKSRQAMRNSDHVAAHRHAWLAFRQRPAVRPALRWAALRVAPGRIGQVKSAKRRVIGGLRAVARRSH